MERERLNTGPKTNYGTDNAEPDLERGITPEEFTGHYAEYNLPHHFQNLVSAVYGLRDELVKLLNYYDYVGEIIEIAKVLQTIYKIISTNDLDKGTTTESGIDLRVANNNTALKGQLNEIKRKLIQDKPSNFPKCLDCISGSKQYLDPLKVAFVLAINGGENPRKYPVPEIKQPASSKEIASWLNHIGSEQPEKPTWHFVRYFYVYAKNHFKIATVFLLGMAFTLAQSAFDWVIADGRRPPEERDPLYVHIALPTFLAATGTFIFAVGLYRSFQQHKRKFEDTDYAKGFMEEAKQRMPPVQMFKQRSPIPTKPTKPDPFQPIRNALAALESLYEEEEGNDMSEKMKTQNLLTLRSYLTNYEATGYDADLASDIRDFFKTHGLKTNYFSLSINTETAPRPRPSFETRFF